MNEHIKELKRHLIYKTTGNLSLIRRIEWQHIIEWIDPKEDERILDVACGTGELSLKIAEKGSEIHAIDMSENAINIAKRLAKRENISCEFIVGNAEDLSYPNEYFDKIICSSSLEHFTNDLKALKEMNRVLKPKGCVVMTVDSLTCPISNELKARHKTYSHVVNYYTHKTLKKRFEFSGFEMKKSKYILSSWITSFFFKISIILCDKNGIIWEIISLFGYPVCLISEKCFGKGDQGYTLIAEGMKIN